MSDYVVPVCRRHCDVHIEVRPSIGVANGLRAFQPGRCKSWIIAQPLCNETH